MPLTPLLDATNCCALLIGRWKERTMLCAHYIQLKAVNRGRSTPIQAHCRLDMRRKLEKRAGEMQLTRLDRCTGGIAGQRRDAGW